MIQKNQQKFQESNKTVQWLDILHRFLYLPIQCTARLTQLDNNLIIDVLTGMKPSEKKYIKRQFQEQKYPLLKQLEDLLTLNNT